MTDLINTVHKIINSHKTSTKRDRRNNETIINDSRTFKGLPVYAIDEITKVTDDYTKSSFEQKGYRFSTLDSVKEHSKKLIFDTAVALTSKKTTAQAIYDSIFNVRNNSGTAIDPTTAGEVIPNLWISPYEANALYSQKGLPEVIINKKSKSILLNGVKIKNAKLTAKEIDAVSLNMLKHGIPKLISDCVRDSLVYGGSIMFPMFNGDNPATTSLNIVALLKQGILKKDSISRFITMDRWNVMHLPAVNPTQKDFLLPEKYYIPFLGSDVHGTRCSRIITGAQAGYFGQVMTLGWGLSDFCAYAREVINYKNAVNTLPMMIQQMSIIARTINVDGLLAQEGSNALDGIIEANTIRMEESSPQNPITMNVLGELQVINRDFAEVPALIRLLRQDLCAQATLPEPLIFSSEKGNFSSGDDTQGNLAKQYESIKYIHKDVESQFKQMAKIIIIDALGTDSSVLEILPYTDIHFDVPVVANSTERAEIGLNLGRSFFEFVSGQMPLAEAAKIASGYGGDEMSLSSEMLERLEERQRLSDEKQKIKFEKEMELLDAQIKQTSSRETESGSEAKKPKKVGDSGEYTRLEQGQHNKTRMPGEKRPEKLSKRMT